MQMRRCWYGNQSLQGRNRLCTVCVCVYVCVCVCLSKRLTAGCEEGQSQSGSYSNAHCPLATLPSLSLSPVLALSLAWCLSTPRCYPNPFHSFSPSLSFSVSLSFFTFHWLSVMMHLDTAHKLKPTQNNCFHTFNDNWTQIHIWHPHLALCYMTNDRFRSFLRQ